MPTDNVALVEYVKASLTLSIVINWVAIYYYDHVYDEMATTHEGASHLN